MTRIMTIIAIAAAAALAGCNKEDHTIVSDPTGGPTNAAANTDVKLPPAIVASHKYRCKDNSLISIDWLSDGTDNSARATAGTAAAVTLAQAEADGAYTGEGGATLNGNPQAQSVTYKGQSCKR